MLYVWYFWVYFSSTMTQKCNGKHFVKRKSQLKKKIKTYHQSICSSVHFDVTRSVSVLTIGFSWREMFLKLVHSIQNGGTAECYPSQEWIPNRSDMSLVLFSTLASADVREVEIQI